MLANKSLIKNIIRSILNNKKYFLFLLLISVFSFSLLLCNNSYPKDMKNTITNFYKNTNSFDVYLSTNVKFKQSDVKQIKDLKIVKGVSLSKELKVKANIKNNDYDIKAVSINPKRNLKDDDYINRLTLSSGKYPSTINEGLIDDKLFERNNLSIGDLVVLTISDNNKLRAKKIKIVGTVKNSLHVDKESKSEKENHYIYLEENNFTDEYNEMYITLNNDSNYDIYSKEYKALIKNCKKEILKVIEPIISDRKKDSILYLNDELESKKDTLNSLYELTLPEESLNNDIEKINNKISNIKKEINSLENDELYSSVKISSSGFKDYKEEVNSTNKFLYAISILIFVASIFLSTFLMCKIVIKDTNENISLKALGYNTLEINAKYIIFIVLSQVISFLIIILLLEKIIPIILWMYYKKIYSIPFIKPNIKIYPVVTLLLVNIAFIILFINVYFVYRKKYVKNM